MDTKPLEIESESYIQHELLKFGFKVTKPTFDTDGADLLIIDDVQNKFTKFLKVQCKGRTLKSNGNHIEIPKEYVTENFVVFLYVRCENFESCLFSFFYQDIVQWNIRNNKYIFNFTFSKLTSQEIVKNKFRHETVKIIKEKLESSMIKKYTSLIIDEGFLNKAISKTIYIYNELYPHKTFDWPETDQVVLNILSMYDNFKSKKKSINCYSYSYCDDLEMPDFINCIKTLSTKDGVKGKIYYEKTDGFVYHEILEHLKRLINTENIILVADDVVYEDPLLKLKQKGIDVTLIMHSTDDGRQMFTKHKWGDVIFPVAQSIGLQPHEW
ncbi:MAG: hypothetical protein GY737_18800 [Desulfobacteraceae bacterium]|nr:hypothetical protein [Desulfobacteraceae bacterium]